MPRALLSEARRLIHEGAAGLSASAPQVPRHLSAPGDVIAATVVIAASGAPGGECLVRCAGRRGQQGLPPCPRADQPVASAEAKSALYRSCGALAVDMESSAVARAARDAGLPFAVLRVVIDAAGRDLPPAAMAAMAPGGGIDLGGLARELWREPRQIAGLISLSRDAAVARRALGRAAALLSAVLAR
jgi:hypothetical protein